MLYCIKFKEVILTAIATDFEFWSESISSAKGLGKFDRFDDVLFVMIKTHGPLI